MGVYIPGMEMPTRCCDCKMYVEDIYCCHLLHREIENPWADDGVESDCPLIPVPPHGDLIDRAELWVEINKICDRRDAGIITDLDCLQQILSAVRHAPTIIEAEEEK